MTSNTSAATTSINAAVAALAKSKALEASAVATASAPSVDILLPIVQPAQQQQQQQQPVPEVITRVVVQAEPKERIFHGDFQTYENFMMPCGKPVAFYKGFHVTDSDEVAAYCSTLKGVRDVTGSMKLADVPVAPSRNRDRRRTSGWHSAAVDPTRMDPATLLKIAVTSTAQTPQAAASNS